MDSKRFFNLMNIFDGVKKETTERSPVEQRVKLPLVDKETLTPNYKMPDCPNCGEDELRMIGIDEAECLKCGVLLTRAAA